MKTDFYDRALRRIVWLTAGVGLAGTVVMLFASGLRPSAGFLAGSAISLANFQGLRTLVSVLDGTPKPLVRSTLAALRYVLIAAAVYVIVKFLEVAPIAVLLGLLAAFGAVLLEVLYELILYART